MSAPPHPHLLDGLNPDQRRAAELIDGPLQVIAGPGSGKTRTITHRIAWMVESGAAAPWNICALTFTNKAAGEMKARVAQLLPGRRGLWVSTFHSMCARILRREAQHLGYDERYSIYDERDRAKAVEGVIAAFELDPKRWAARRVAQLISDAKSRLLDPHALANEAEDAEMLTVARIYEGYEQAMRRQNAMDFDDLLLKTVELFYAVPEVLASYQDRLRYLMVDEYQDTNLAQYEIASLLAREHGNICVTGDPDQSIYSWRGANPANFANFREDFPDHQTVCLTINYRSTGVILDAADALINNNPGRMFERLSTPNPRGDPLVLIACERDREEAASVAVKIRELMNKDGLPPSAFAVFYRLNSLSRLFEEALTRAKIPFVVVGAIGFYQRKEVKDLLAYLALLTNPRDEVALLRVINVPARGVGKTSLARLIRFASDRGLTLRRAIAQHDEIEELKGRGKKGVAAFDALLTDLRARADVCDGVAPLLEYLLERSGYTAMLQTAKDAEESDRLDNVAELLTAAKDFDDEKSMADKPPRVADFLEEVSLVRSSEEGDNERVQLMSLHAAKGLEFPVVFIAGVENDLLPHSRAWESLSEMEEERRLLYVGITRAEQRLYFSHARWRHRFNQPMATCPSDFLDEIPPNLFAHEQAAEAWSDRPEPAGERFQAGERVRHAYFGVGTVISVEGSGRRARARIHFPDGTRTMILEHANLIRSKL